MVSACCGGAVPFRGLSNPGLGINATTSTSLLITVRDCRSMDVPVAANVLGTIGAVRIMNQLMVGWVLNFISRSVGLFRLVNIVQSRGDERSRFIIFS